MEHNCWINWMAVTSIPPPPSHHRHPSTPYRTVDMPLRSALVPTLMILFVATGSAVAGDEESASKDEQSGAGTFEQTEASPADPRHVLERLLEGNARFVAGKSQHPHESSRWRASLEDQQHPQAVVLGCADSRVPPEIIFDQGLGDLFVVRVAGNIVDTDVTASIEYAVDHLETQLVVVLGHSSCGAVTAAYQHLMKDTLDADEIESLLYRIEPALTSVPSSGPLEARIDRCVRSNVDMSVRRLAQVPDVMKSLRAGRLLIVGAIYDLHSGRVELTGSSAPEKTAKQRRSLSGPSDDRPSEDDASEESAAAKNEK